MAERPEKHGFAKQAFDKVGAFITYSKHHQVCYRENLLKQCFCFYLYTK